MLECHIIIAGIFLEKDTVYDSLHIVPIRGIEYQTWRCIMSEFRFKIAINFIYLKLDNISRYMEFKVCSNVLIETPIFFHV